MRLALALISDKQLMKMCNCHGLAPQFDQLTELLTAIY